MWLLKCAQNPPRPPSVLDVDNLEEVSRILENSPALGKSGGSIGKSLDP